MSNFCTTLVLDIFYHLFSARGLVKLKKSEKNSACPDNTHLPAYQILIFF